MTDWGDLYREHVADISAMAAELSDDQLATTVPATPKWTVGLVLCHMAGGAEDGLTDRMDGAPSPEWTARHVGERADRPVAEVLTELQSNQDAVAASLEGNPFPAAVFDISVHHADLHEALGKPRLGEHLWLPVLDAMRPRLDPSLFDHATDYEVYRGLFSRRSRAQMQAWGTDLSDEALDEMTIFGPREDDQPIPA
jgi:mono/diheme cytochrome c family protein